MGDYGDNVSNGNRIKEHLVTRFEAVYNENIKKWRGQIVNTANNEVLWLTPELSNQAACLATIETARLTNTYTVTKIVTTKGATTK